MIAALAFASCDTIEGDYVNVSGAPDPNNNVIVQRVLLEEFTGVQCNNCPAANAKAVELHDFYGDQVILLGLHSGNFATTSPDHPRAFNTPEADELYSFFSIFGVPVGMINREDYETQAIAKGSGSWSSEINALLDPSNTVLAEITFDTNYVYDSNTRELTVSGQMQILENLPSDQIYLSLFLAENDIVSPQTLQDKSVDPNYVHQHVFRGSFNSTFGAQLDLSQDTITFNESITLSDPEIVKENCEVIAFVYDREDFQIIQVNKIKLD